ncbi:ribonuclease 2 precursor, putative [Entamoeba invadens IP1]|uniref:Ribonuclease 2, putative n=1 Tax=Entamoeba invadens IP1 TaxID=370355 RepID=A0A0A1U5K2_ENTIV|nr:ribonuclease 2 precursor, putative [Entamoeba invadens IP1]ELP89507.1 ribonuclease 2 precursor, putative [Entamoeba invadens IP1]|eukprot:XP_004256278.1 ribonuclease 2 precursor, putative [Entamoeba invadens IP1]
MNTMVCVTFFLITLSIACDFTPTIPCINTTQARGVMFAYLVLSWPGTFCLDKCCHSSIPLDKGFSIHGYWPQISYTEYPSCCYTQWTSDAISTYISTHPTLQNDLATYWPSLKRCLFFNYEFLKHATCLPSLFSGKDAPSDFASIPLNFVKSHDVWAALKNNGIRDDYTKYSKSFITDILFRVFNATPILFCDGEYFDELRLCSQIPYFNEVKEPNVFNCSSEAKQLETCGDIIVFPPYPEVDTNSICYY